MWLAKSKYKYALQRLMGMWFGLALEPKNISLWKTEGLRLRGILTCKHVALRSGTWMKEDCLMVQMIVL